MRVIHSERLADPIPAPLPPLKMEKLDLWSKKMRNLLKPMNKHFFRLLRFLFFEKCSILYSVFIEN